MTGPSNLAGQELDVVEVHLDCYGGLEELVVGSLDRLVDRLGLRLVQLPGAIAQTSLPSAVVHLAFRRGLDLTIGSVPKSFVEMVAAPAFGTADRLAGIFEVGLVAQGHILVLEEADLSQACREGGLFHGDRSEGRLQ